jgi:RHS repeat-associated protein
MADGVRYEHDEDGNQTLKSGPDGDWHYRWNGHGMLREVERPDGVRVAFDYDPFARRTAKRTLSAAGAVDQEVQFVWDGHNVIHELDSERGLVSWQWEPESFTPIAKEHAGRRWTIASDHLGTPTEMYDDLGQLAWKMQLDVYGVPRFDAGTAEDCPWRWPGQYEDGATGLFYNRLRHYAASVGEYCSADPLGLAGGLRSHAYPSDTVSAVDPLGLISTAPGVYRVFFEATLDRSLFLESDSVHFRESNRQLASAMRNDPSLRATLEAAYPSTVGLAERGLRDGMPIAPRQRGAIPTDAPAGLTWHHHPEVPGLMQLVDSSDHNTRFPDYHPDGVGGRNRWGGGTSCR